jgi:hypothetical protein
MFYIGRKPVINPEMSKHIREQTNKFANKLKEKYSNINGKNLVITQNKDFHNCCNIIPFVSLFSFILGYNFCYYTKK